MALKTFTAGERLFAADLNDNFEHVEDATNILVPSTDDTGAPWNIPYIDGGAAGTLAAADEAQALAIAAGLSAAGNAGIGTNVAQTIKTDTFSTSSTAFTTVTGLTATITPTSATSKILIIAQVSVSPASDQTAHVALAGGNAGNYVGDAASNRVRTVGWVRDVPTDIRSQVSTQMMTISYLDSPTTIAATTYAVQMRVSSGTSHVNRSTFDLDATTYGRNASSITLIEVKA